MKIVRKVADAWKFGRFERSIHPDTWRLHDGVLRWAEDNVAHAGQHEALECYLSSTDPVVRQGDTLAKRVKNSFHDKFASQEGVRLLVHLPGADVSPGGYSVICNLIQSLQFLGVPVLGFASGSPTEELLARFKPSVMLVGDYRPFLSGIDWQAVDRYKRHNRLLVGLTASLEEYGNSPLNERIKWAHEHGTDFYFTFRSQGYVNARKEYAPFFDAGYRILSLEFGVNPLVYYPVPGIERDLNYVFLASSNRDKLPRYISFLGKVFSEYPGLIDGPGWSRVSSFTFNSARDRYLYARAKVGINLHLEEQIEWACELNERTYMLAACGTPQLVDNPKLLGEHFSCDAFFVASSPREYKDMFDALVAEPELGMKAALKAQEEVFEKHTTFHRADQFVASLLAQL